MSAAWEQTSLLCALIANCHSTKKRYKARDFNPFDRPVKPVMNGEQAVKWLKDKFNAKR